MAIFRSGQKKKEVDLRKLLEKIDASILKFVVPNKLVNVSKNLYLTNRENILICSVLWCQHLKWAFGKIGMKITNLEEML